MGMAYGPKLRPEPTGLFCTALPLCDTWYLKVSEENQGALQGPLGGKMGWKKVVRLKMTSEGRVCLGLADVKRYGVPYFGRSDTESGDIVCWNL